MEDEAREGPHGMGSEQGNWVEKMVYTLAKAKRPGAPCSLKPVAPLLILCSVFVFLLIKRDFQTIQSSGPSKPGSAVGAGELSQLMRNPG